MGSKLCTGGRGREEKIHLCCPGYSGSSIDVCFLPLRPPHPVLIVHRNQIRSGPRTEQVENEMEGCVGTNMEQGLLQ